MADNIVELHLQVNTETGAVDQLNQKLKETQDAAGATGDAFKKTTDTAGDLLKQFGLIATAAGIVEFFKSSVDAATQNEEAMHRLATALDLNGISWEKNKDSVTEWGEAIAASTRFGENEALDTLGKLVRVTGSLAQAEQASKVAMGLSVASGRDLGETTQMVTLLLNGNERAIRQVRNEYGSFVGNSRSAQEALNALNTKFSETAIKEDSFTKTTAQLRNAFEQFEVQIGRAFMPALTGIFNGFTTTIRVFDELVLGFSTGAAKIITYAEGMGKALVAGFKMDPKGVEAAFRETASAIEGINEGAVQQFNELEKKRTATVAVESAKQIQLRAKALAEDPKAIAEHTKHVREMMNAELKERLNAAHKVESLELDLEKKIQQVGQQTLSKKIAQMNAEVAQERNKIQQEVKDKTAQMNDLIKLDVYRNQKEADLVKQDLIMKSEAAMQVVDLGLQTLNTLNSMGEQNNQAEANRAKAILALEKAIAIARAIAAAQSAGPFAGALAAAQIALIVTQFAQQSKAIDQAAAQGGSSVTASVDSGASVGVDAAAALTVSTGGGANAGGTTVVVPTISGGTTGVGGTGTNTGTQNIDNSVVNIGGITIALSVATLSPADRQIVLRQLTDEIRAATVDAVRFAVTSANLASRNAQVAV